jgi:single-stranded DNA-binding protein
MSKYKFDGKMLKFGGSTIANVSGNNIRKGSGSSVEGNIKNDQIRKGSGSSVIANVSGRDIRQGTGSSKIGTMDDVDKVIEGPGGITKAALWILFVK